MAPNVGSLKQQYHMWLGLSFRRSAMTWSRQLRKRRVTTCLPLNFNKHHRICSFWAPMLAMMIRGMGVEICVRAVLKRMCLSHRNISWIENNVLVWASKEPKHHVCMCVCVRAHSIHESCTCTFLGPWFHCATAGRDMKSTGLSHLQLSESLSVGKLPPVLAPRAASIIWKRWLRHTKTKRKTGLVRLLSTLCLYIYI